MAATLLVVGLVNALTAAVFAAVGARLARREVEAQDRLAVRAIAAWWLCMGILEGIQAAETLAWVAGFSDLRVSTAARYANGALLAVGGWGLCFHVAYLRTGSRAWAFPLAFYYVFVTVGHWMSTFLHPVVRLEQATYEVTNVYDPPLAGSTIQNVVAPAIGLPLIAACILYLLLSRKLKRRDQKRRAVLASSGILAWMSGALAAHLTASPLADFLTITALSLGAAALAFLAYFPPEILRRGDAQTGSFLEVVHPPLPAEEVLWSR